MIESDTTHRDVPRIPQQDAPLHCQHTSSGTLPLRSTACLLFLANVPINCLLLSVDNNPIAVLDKRDWSPQTRLGYDMACILFSVSFRSAQVGLRYCVAQNVPMINPCDAPEKRPSVISAVDPASPAPINAPVGPCVTASKSQLSKTSYRPDPSLAYLTSTEEDGPGGVQCACMTQYRVRAERTGGLWGSCHFTSGMPGAPLGP